MSITTRFAPSPTGYLHIGGARTALFSWLLAKNKGGHFLLRVEDTDRERSTQEATDAIIQAMAWLDLAAEGTAVFQSQRFDLYNSYIDQLLASGHAYWCKCTPDEVEAMREKARAEGKKPKYDGRCREQGLGPGAGCVVRFKIGSDIWAPEGLLSTLQAVEGKMGREREPGNEGGPRNIDLDLLMFGDLQMQGEYLTLPHPRMLERAFVLVPLRDIAPGFVFADGKTIDQALAALSYTLDGRNISQK